MASRPGRSKAKPAAAKTKPTPCGIEVLTQDEIAAIGRGAAVTEEQKQRVFGLAHDVRHPGRTGAAAVSCNSKPAMEDIASVDSPEERSSAADEQSDCTSCLRDIKCAFERLQPASSSKEAGAAGANSVGARITQGPKVVHEPSVMHLVLKTKGM